MTKYRIVPFVHYKTLDINYVIEKKAWIGWDTYVEPTSTLVWYIPEFLTLKDAKAKIDDLLGREEYTAQHHKEYKARVKALPKPEEYP